MMTISINVEPYLAHYMYARYDNCIHEGAIKLSHRANLYHILLELTAPRPQGISWHDTGNLILALPVPDIGKDPRTYNYLSGESIHLLAVKINRQMRREMIEYMLSEKFEHGVMYKRSLIHFIADYDMNELINEDTLMKHFQLWRKKEKLEKIKERGDAQAPTQHL